MKWPWRLRLHMRLLVAGLSVATGALAQSPAPTPDLNRIVTRMEHAGMRPAKVISQYRSRRHYTVEYRGLRRQAFIESAVSA